MPELSAVTTLHAVHAVDMPNEDPHFIFDSALDQPRIVRLNDNMLDVLMAAKESHRCKKTPDECRESAECSKNCSRASRLIKACDWDGLSDDGATNAIVKAKIGIDLLTDFVGLAVDLDRTRHCGPRAVGDGDAQIARIGLTELADAHEQRE